MSKPKPPTSGGSYVRAPSGKLERQEAEKPKPASKPKPAKPAPKSEKET